MLKFFEYMQMSTINRRGRPQKEDSASEVIPPIRVTAEQKYMYKIAAKEAGMSLSGWLKFLADSATEIQVPNQK